MIDFYTDLKRFAAGLMISAVAFLAYGQSNGQIAAGYSGRELAKSSEWGRDDAGTISAAIKLDSEMLQGLSGVKNMRSVRRTCFPPKRRECLCMGAFLS